MTLENTPAAAYLRTDEEHNARVMEADGSISLRDSGISDATTTAKPSSSSSTSSALSCILCMECIGDWNALKRHLVKNHEVKREALHAFMSLVDHPKLTSSSSPADDESNSWVIDRGNNDELTEKSRETVNVTAAYFSGGSGKRSVDRNDESAVECGICSATFPDCAFLFKHQDETDHLVVRMTPAGPRYACWHAECGQTFSTVTLLRCHFVNTHVAKSDGNGDAPTATVTSELTETGDRFQCHQCDQVLKKREEFRMHCYCHKMEKAMECCSCGTRFSSIHEFRKHKQVVHNEELTSEQQELYRASLAAASSLALLGASGLEYMTNHSSRTSNLTATVRKKDAPSGEAESVTETAAVENSAAEDKMDPRLDENSNQSKFVGIKGSAGLAEDTEVVNCSQNGLLHNKCFSCKTGFDGTNSSTDGQQKHKRKRTHPSKVISDLSKQNSVSSVCTVGKNDSYSSDQSMLNLRASFINKNPLIESAAPTGQLPVLVNTTLSSSSSSATSQSGHLARPLQPTDRPFRCSLCKVSYTQKMQLDSHLSSQQHLARCAKISDPLVRQRASATSMQMMLPFAGNQADQVNQFAELMRQQRIPIPSFLPFGVPLVNPMMMPLLTNCVAPSLDRQSFEADVMSASSTPAKQISTLGKPSKHREVEAKLEPVSDLNPTSKSVPCDDVAEKTEYSCSRCCETFSSVEKLDRHKEETDCIEAARNILAPDLNSSGCNQTMMESILQRIGYECVKQFNEYRQKPKQSNRHTSNSEFGKGSLEDSKSSCEAQEARNVEESESERNEKNKYFCWMCSKSFSTIFVLKAHQEQVHNQVIPIDAIEKLQSELKANYERICKQECSERSDTSGQRRRHETFPAVRQASAEEETKFKQQQQQQQFQIAAAIQNMQMNLMLSSGILPQVFQRLPGSGHIASIPPELFAPQPFSIIDPMLMVQLQQRQSTPSMTLPVASPTQLSSAAAANQKSARTRISEQQLLVLRANFDINNSPTEEQIQEMSEKTGLVMKVIKHWFRNTLFKERQRNKDSPYNFNVPPVTTLSLSDCERMPRTSAAKETSSSSDENSVNASNLNSDLLSEPRSESAVTDLAAKSEIMANDSMSNIEKASLSQMPSRSEDKIALSSQGTSEFKLMDPQHGINLNAVMMNNLYNIPHGAERRAGRTRFSNHQNQVLQEFFDRNPYPKDDEVEALSRALNLRVRVIVVWFQNARQRIRKTEGHTLLAEGTKQAQFQSGMCGFSPDQQMELLQHQLAEHSMSKGSGHGPSGSNQVSIDDEEQGSGSSVGNEPDYDNTGRRSTEDIKLECDRAFEFADHLNEHQRDMQSSQNHSILSPFAGSMRQQLHFGQKLLPELNQKMVEDGAFLQQASDNEERRADRRMRTTLAQDQLEYLYQKFAAESNPSRSALEAIAAHLNLKPRVVQVWFQNTRARERRGQHRVNSQKSLVRCPCCSSMFRGKTALEAHLAEQHPQSISSIGYPVDLVRNMQMMSSGMESVVPPFLSPGPMMTAAGISTLQSNMHYLYEKSFQEYMSKLTNLPAPTQQMVPSSSSSSSNQSIQSAPITKPAEQTSTKTEDGPLDLTTSSGMTRNDRNGQLISEAVDVSHSSLFTQNLDDSFSETYSENDENGGFRGVDNTSPSTLNANPSCSGAMFGVGKRYRTQMSSLQIRVLRAIFSSYKTPSLAECEILGQQIGLGKRVVQVWFQNSRAKEKKANFPGFEKSDGIGAAGGNAFFPQLGSSPASCCLCNVTYSINHTMQDHLFTKIHIDRVKAVVNSSEFGKSFPNIAFGESGDSFDQHKQFPSKNPLPAIKPMTNLPTVISTRTLELAADMHSNSNNHSVSFERNSKRQQLTPKKVSRSQPRGQPGDSEKNVQNNAPVLSPSMAFVNPLDASLRQFVGVPPASTDLLGAMMPYLYQSGAIPPVLPGFNPMQLLSQAPNILPNMAYALLNSAAVCGIQLVQLQIPKRAIEQIQDRLKDKTCVLATYSEDCLTSAEVKTHLDSGEIAWLVEKSIHVGYICKRCHIVFPQVDACNAHQMALCFKGAEHFGDSVLKLEQRLYQCSCCKVQCATVNEFKAHCAQENHRKAGSPGAGSFVSRTNSTMSSSGVSQRLVEDAVPKEGQSPSVADVKLEKEDG